jgi:uncharacterized membrane protein YfcA
MISVYTTIITTAIGILSGLVGGALGLGGTPVMLPALILLNVIPNYNKVVGTILFSLLPPVSLLAVFEYGRKKQIDYWLGTVLFVSYFAAAYYGSVINTMYSTRTLKYATGIIFLIVAFMFLYNARYSSIIE